MQQGRSWIEQEAGLRPCAAAWPWRTAIGSRPQELGCVAALSGPFASGDPAAPPVDPSTYAPGRMYLGWLEAYLPECVRLEDWPKTRLSEPKRQRSVAPLFADASGSDGFFSAILFRAQQRGAANL